MTDDLPTRATILAGLIRQGVMPDPGKLANILDELCGEIAARPDADDAVVKRILEMSDADVLALVPKEEVDHAVTTGKQAVKIALLQTERDAAICERDDARDIIGQMDVEASRTATAIGAEFMLDPPDGGDVKLWEGAGRIAKALAAARAEVERLQAEVANAIERAHYAEGTADLAMKHRDEAEAENARLRKALRNIEVRGPDADDLVWLAFYGGGTTGQGFVRIGTPRTIVAQVAMKFEEDRRAVLTPKEI